MQRTRGASRRSPLTLRLCSGNQLRRPRLMQFQPDSSGHAGSALRTTGEPRRGRCKKSTGAEGSVFFRALGHAASRLTTVMSSSPAPHRFAHRAAPLKAARSSNAQARSFASGSVPVSSPARPSSAHAPGRSSAGFPLFLLSLPRSSPRRTLPQRPGSPPGIPRSAPPTLRGYLLSALSRARKGVDRCITRACS